MREGDEGGSREKEKWEGERLRESEKFLLLLSVVEPVQSVPATGSRLRITQFL